MEILIEGELSKKKKLLKKLDLDEYDVNIKEVDIGCGADWWFTALAVSGGIFLAGKSIEDNLVAWMRIGNRIKKIFKKRKKSQIFIDNEAAIALAVNAVAKRVGKIKSIDLVFSKELSTGGLEKIYRDGRKKGELPSAPFNFYLLIFKVNDNDQYIFGIKSNGKIKCREVFNDAWFDYHHDWDQLKIKKIKE